MAAVLFLQGAHLIGVPSLQLPACQILHGVQLPSPLCRQHAWNRSRCHQRRQSEGQQEQLCISFLGGQLARHGTPAFLFAELV